MKIVHVLKRIETIDQDVKDLRKLEKSLQKNKSFSTPIYMTIEKQINILVDERVKLLGLEISNPPVGLAELYDDSEDDVVIPTPLKKNKRTKKSKPVKSTAPKKTEVQVEDDDDDDDLPEQMLTQDSIDSRFDQLKKESDAVNKKDEPKDIKADSEEGDEDDDNSVKLLDIALHKGALNKEEIQQEKRRVKFFRDNFPGAES